MVAKISASISWFEYFLYTAIILETALAAFVYKVLFRGPGLTSLTISLTIIYFGFLAWAIFQLNHLHRRRKHAPSTVVIGTKQEEPSIPAPRAEGTEIAEPAQRILGLTAAQAVVVFVVFAAALVSFTWALSIFNPNR
jgi:hypothetical protein